MSGFRVVGGAPTSPVILHVPHGCRHIPAEVRAGITLDDSALAAELDRMTDAHTGEIAELAAGAVAVRPWTFVNLTSRLVVDPERLPDDEMLAVGMGAVYTRTAQGGPLRPDRPAQAEELLAAYFRPYAAAISDLVDDRLATTGRAAIIDVHSYPRVALPYELHGAGERPAICLGTHPAHTPPWLLDAARAAFAGCGNVAENTPFAGCYVPLRHFRRQPAVTALMVEIRRDTYLAEPGGPPTDGIHRVAGALARLVDAATAGG